MKRAFAVIPCVVLALALASPARAQVKEIPGESVTATGTVEAIDHQARLLTLKDAETGEMVTVDVPAGARRFDEIKVGDKVQATYYDNVTVRLKKPGEKAVNTGEAAVTPGAGARPGATIAAQRTMTATIEAIDPKVPPDHVRRAEGLEVQPPDPGQERPQAGQGGRPGRLHLDRGGHDRGRRAEEVASHEDARSRARGSSAGGRRLR
jgi:Cu/Ag efflux protein CusF